jgi:hypothetical protein
MYDWSTYPRHETDSSQDSSHVVHLLQLLADRFYMVFMVKQVNEMWSMFQSNLET